VTLFVTDSIGLLHRHDIFPTKEDQTAIASIWQIIYETCILNLNSWRVVICKMGPFGDGEMREWQGLASSSRSNPKNAWGVYGRMLSVTLVCCVPPTLGLFDSLDDREQPSFREWLHAQDVSFVVDQVVATAIVLNRTVPMMAGNDWISTLAWGATILMGTERFEMRDIQEVHNSN
jgi:hypothetical protein